MPGAIQSKIQYLESIAELIPASLFAKDNKRRYIYVNSNFVRAAGFKSEEDILGKTSEEIFYGKRQGTAIAGSALDVWYYGLRNTADLLSCMACKPRIQLPGARYHVISPWQLPDVRVWVTPAMRAVKSTQHQTSRADPNGLKLSKSGQFFSNKMK